MSVSVCFGTMRESIALYDWQELVYTRPLGNFLPASQLEA